MFKTLNSFPTVVLKNKFEREIYELISVGKKEYFYLEDLSKKLSDRPKYFEARRQLLIQGQIISMFPKDIGFEIFKHPTDIREKKIINLTWQGIREPLFIKDGKQMNENMFKNYWQPVWLDTYNNYIEYYLPKIKNFL